MGPRRVMLEAKSRQHMNVINCSDVEKNNNISQFYIIDDVKSRERPKIGRDHQLGEKGE